MIVWTLRRRVWQHCSERENEKKNCPFWFHGDCAWSPGADGAVIMKGAWESLHCWESLPYKMAMRIYRLGVTVVHWGQRSSVYSMIRMCCHGFLSFSTLCPCYYKAPYSLLSLILFFLHLTQVDLLSTDDSVPVFLNAVIFISNLYLLPFPNPHSIIFLLVIFIFHSIPPKTAFGSTHTWTLGQMVTGTKTQFYLIELSTHLSTHRPLFQRAINHF